MTQVINPRHPDSYIPLPEFETGVLRDILEQNNGLHARTCITAMHIIGELDVSTLRDCITSVVCRHESLRVKYSIIDNNPTIHVNSKYRFYLDVADITASPRAYEEVNRLAQAFANEEFNVFSDPLFGFKLIKLSNNEYVLISAFDHLISDATSMEIVNREIWTLYNKAAHGLPLELPRPTIQLPDYYVWRHETHDAWKEAHEHYWRTHLAGALATQVPIDNGVTAMMPSAQEVAHILFGKELSAILAKMARGERTFLSLLVLTLYIIVMSRWCSQRDLLICFANNGRFVPELKNVTGFIVHGLYMRVEIAHRDTFRDLLRKLIAELDSAIHHRDFNRVPFIIPECKTELRFNWVPTEFKASLSQDVEDSHSITGGRVGRIPFAVPECGTELSFNSTRIDFGQSLTTDKPHMPGHIRLQRFPFFPRRSSPPPKFVPIFYETAAGINIIVRYPTNSIAPSTVSRFGRNLRSLAAEFAQNPNARIESVSLETQ